MNTYKQAIEKMISETGITLNGNKPGDIQIHNEEFYKRVLQNGSLGVGESYMEGLWDCDELDVFFYKIFSNEIEKKVRSNWGLYLRF